jgi:hypothetical protein
VLGLLMTTTTEATGTKEARNGRLRILLRSSPGSDAYDACSGTCGACCCYEKEET